MGFNNGNPPRDPPQQRGRDADWPRDYRDANTLSVRARPR
jgi:hypothetical protein